MTNQDKALQQLQARFQEFSVWEASWIDDLVRKQYSRLTIWGAELSMRPPFGFIQKILALFAGLEINRHQNISKPGKGFQRGSTRIISITTKVYQRSKWEMFLNTADILLTKLHLRQGKYRRGSLIGDRTFPVNIIVRGDLNEILRKINR